MAQMYPMQEVLRRMKKSVDGSHVLIQVDLGGQPPFPLNQHFEPMVLINHDIHPFDGEWNVMSSSFVNYKHRVMIS